MNSIGTPAQQLRFTVATKNAVFYLNDPNAPEPEMFTALQEFHDAKSDMIGYCDGWVLDKDKVRRRFKMSIRESNESVAGRAFRKKVEKEAQAAAKVAVKPATKNPPHFWKRSSDIALPGSRAGSERVKNTQAAVQRASGAAKRTQALVGGAAA